MQSSCSSSISLSSDSSSNQKPKLGLLTCTFLVVAIMAGTGIYTSLGIQLNSLSSGFGLLLLWGVGGLMALFGALSYAELASLMPESGGEYYYISRVYHPALGAMVGIIVSIAGFVAPVALTSMAFGSYLKAVFPWINPTLAAMSLVTLITIMHMVNTAWSAMFQDAITGVKFFLMLLVFGVGFYCAKMPVSVLLPGPGCWKELLTPGVGVVLIFCYYAYSGWNSATYIAGEARSSATVGYSLILGTLGVILIYLLTNIVFLLAVPTYELRGVLDVGHVVATHLLGEQGGRFLSASIVIGIIAGVSGMIWVGPRIAEAMGKDLETLHWLSKTTKSGVPVRATLLQYVMVMLLLASSSFQFILVTSQFPIILSEVITVLALFTVRHRQARQRSFSPFITGEEGVKKASFRCPLYPIVPLIFVLVSVAAAGYTFFTNPKEGIFGIGFILLSVACYPLLDWHHKKRR